MVLVAVLVQLFRVGRLHRLRVDVVVQQDLGGLLVLAAAARVNDDGVISGDRGRQRFLLVRGVFRGSLFNPPAPLPPGRHWGAADRSPPAPSY